MPKKADPMDIYSIREETVTTELALRFKMKPREEEGNEGRKLLVNYDKRFPLISGLHDFEVRYSYSEFFDKGIVAGHHYHKKKSELMIVQSGSFIFKLEDIETGEQESFEISVDDHEIVFVRTSVAHSVKALENDSVLLILATSQNSDGDEIKYFLK